MRLRCRQIFLFAITCVLLGACGPSSSSDDGLSADTPHEYYDNFTRVTQEKLCESVWSCPHRRTQLLTSLFAAYPSLEACKEGKIVPTLYEGLVDTPEFQQDIDADRVSYDQAQAEKCLGEIQSLYEDAAPNCSEPLPSTSEVQCSRSDIYTGSSEQGGTCATDAACQGDQLECDVPQDQCEGTCTQDSSNGQNGGAEQGETCDFGTPCADSLECIPSGSGSGQSTCQPSYSQGEGDPCAANDHCEPQLTCANDQCTEVDIVGVGEECGGRATVCEPGLACNTDPDPSVCVEVKTAGSSCSVDDECPGIQVCIQGTCGETREAGESCTADEQCQSDMCGSGGTCVADNNQSACTMN